MQRIFIHLKLNNLFFLILTNLIFDVLLPQDTFKQFGQIS